MKAFFVTFFLALASVFCLNSWVDVSGLDTFRETYRLAAIQGDSELLVRHDIFDQRAWLKARLLEKKACPDILVLGSSTLGGFQQKLFPGKTLLNGWMTGPTMQDFEGITAILEKADCRPKLVVFGIDPWFFDPTDTSLRWLSIAGEYVDYNRVHGTPVDYARARLEVLMHQLEPLQERLGYQTTRQALLSLKANWKTKVDHSEGQPQLVSDSLLGFCTKTAADFWIRFADGHWDRCPAFERPLSDVIFMGQHYVNDGMGLAKMDHLDKARLKGLNRLVEVWKSRGSEVLLLAPPHNPFAYESLLRHPVTSQRLLELDRTLGEMAATHHATYLNLRNPAQVDCKIEEFRDPYHLKNACVGKVVHYLHENPQSGLALAPLPDREKDL